MSPSWEGLSFSTFLPALLTVWFLIIAPTVALKWHLTVASACVSLMADDVEPLLRCLSPSLCLLGEMCIQPFVHFQIGFCIFFAVEF
jgi:hypothetical protein